MLSPFEKAIIISGTMLGSVALFTTALTGINTISNTSHRNEYMYQLNTAVMFFSAATFGSLTYIAFSN